MRSILLHIILRNKGDTDCDLFGFSVLYKPTQVSEHLMIASACVILIDLIIRILDIYDIVIYHRQ